MEAENVNLVLIIVSVLAGVIVGGGGVASVLYRAYANKELKDSTEQLLANSVPPQALEQINAIVNRALDVFIPIARDAVQFVEDVTDGEPNNPAAG